MKISSTLIIKIPSSEIAFLNFVFEGYDHLANLTVLNAKEGLVKLSFYFTEKNLIEEVLEDLTQNNQIAITIIQKNQEILTFSEMQD